MHTASTRPLADIRAMIIISVLFVPLMFNNFHYSCNLILLKLMPALFTESTQINKPMLDSKQESGFLCLLKKNINSKFMWPLLQSFIIFNNLFFWIQLDIC